MTALYQLAILGSPTDAQVSDLEQIIGNTVTMFGLQLGQEVEWYIRPAVFDPQQQTSAAAVFFGGKDTSTANVKNLVERSIPLLPVISEMNQVEAEMPPDLWKFNCLVYADGGAQRVATALLECAGLLPRQRRVFVSYRRCDAKEAALQLFDALSARLFDVFLDTHGIPPAEDFQALLWHRLCDSDVLLMLDTPGYFESRWTNAEFGRALAKGISVLRVGWPDATPSVRTATASRAELLPEEVDHATGHIAAEAVKRICLQLEQVRSQGHAVRSVNLISRIRNEIQLIGGQVTGVGPNRAVHIHLPKQGNVVVYPAVGVPTSSTLHNASINSPNGSVAVVYDHVGLHPIWLGHLDWLGEHIHSVRWVKASEISWQFADWGHKL